MILRDPPSPIGLFLVLQGSVVPRILPQLIGAGIWALAVGLTNAFVVSLPALSLSAMGIFGASLSLFLGFRNNAAYDRWWEARKIWGGMVSDVRSFAQEIRIFGGSDQDCTFILTHILAFHHLHRGQLRGDDVTEAVRKWVGTDNAELLLRHGNGPNAALRAVAGRVREMADGGRIDGFGQRALSERLARFAGAQAANERLRSTPLPFVYSLLIWRTTYLYCLMIPFALIGSVGWFEPVLVVVVAYVFFGLAEVTHELEHPFGTLGNCMPLSALCRVMEISVCHALDRDAPDPMQPVNFVLN